MSRPLLIFAHPGEGQAFINTDRLTRSPLPNHYRGKKYDLLITGGGAEKTLITVTRTLASLNSPSHKEVSEIINLGIAAGLDTHLKKHGVYTIATVYAYREGKPVYESFPLSHPQGPRSSSIRDCLTVNTPVHPRSRNRLSAFADIADMELWWIAYVAKEFGIPVRAVKLISDYGVTSNKNKKIKADAKPASQALYTWYHEHLAKEKPPTPPSVRKWEKEIVTFLHLTASQKKILHTLLSKLDEKLNSDQIKEIINWEEINKKKLTPKQKTSLMIDRLRHHMHPVSVSYHRKLRELTSRGKGIDLGFDPLLESPEIHCSFKFSAAKEWEKKKAELSKIPVKEIFSLLQGKSPPENV